MKENCVKYRTVVNDAVVREWELMPEVQPATVTGLIDYLKRECNINPEPIQPDGWRGEGFVVRYGYHKQFWIPTEPTPAEVELMNEWHSTPDNLPCPICGTTLEFGNDIGFGVGVEEVVSASCPKCELKFSPRGQLALSPRRLITLLSKK